MTSAGSMEQLLTLVNQLDYSSGRIQWYRSCGGRERAHVTCGLMTEVEHVTGGLVTSGVWVESIGSVTGGDCVALFNQDV